MIEIILYRPSPLSMADTDTRSSTLATLKRDKKEIASGDPRAPRRVLTASEGEAFERQLSEPARKPTPAMKEAVRAYKRFMSEPSAK